MTVITKQILIVDDDPPLLELLTQSLSPYHALELKTASDGVEAIAVLEEGAVDLVVTDIKMPRLDGFGLVSHISQYHSRVPVIIMTAHASPSMEHKLNRMGIVSFEKKPIDMDSLTNRVFDLLVGVDSGYLQGISIPSFLQILQADRKSCSLKVTDGTKTGFLHLIDGQILDAELDGQRGEEAAMSLIAWDESLTIDIQQVVRLRDKSISKDTTFLIMDALRQKDESGQPPGQEPENFMGDFILPCLSFPPPPAHVSSDAAVCINPGAKFSGTITDDDRRFYCDALDALFSVKGYRASAVITHDGTPFATHAEGSDTDVEFIAKIVNEMFCGLQSQAVRLGMGPLEESVFRSKEGIILIRCISHEESLHTHLVAIVGNAEGEGMMRVRLKRVAETVTNGSV